MMFRVQVSSSCAYHALHRFIRSTDRDLFILRSVTLFALPMQGKACKEELSASSPSQLVLQALLAEEHSQSDSLRQAAKPSSLE